MSGGPRPIQTIHLKLTPELLARLDAEVQRKRAADPAATYTRTSVLRGLVCLMQAAEEPTPATKRRPRRS